MNECSPEIVSHCIGVGGVEVHLICHKHGFLFASGGHNPNRTVLAFLRVWGDHVLNPLQKPGSHALAQTMVEVQEPELATHLL